MATAAPAAPSATPAGSPAPAPGAAPETTAPAAPARGTLRPIPPPPPLPGVLPDDPSAPSPRDAASHPPAGDRARGPNGRFLPGDATPPESATLEGEHTQPQERYRFAGDEFDSQEHAEQSFRTLRGQFKPVMGLAKQLGGVDKIAPTIERAAASARAWQAEANRLSAELDQYRAGRPATAPTPETPTAPAQPETDSDGVDWELYAEIKRLATEAGEPIKAEQWLMQQIQAAERSRYEKLVDERMAPFTAAQERAATAQHTETLFGHLAGYTNGDGTPAFPELHDESAAYEVGRIWAGLGLPPEAALTPQGALAAIGIYRMTKSRAGANSDTANATRTVTSSVPPAPVAPSDAAAAAGLDDGRTMPMSPRLDGPSAEAARILGALRSVNNGNRSLLGFDA